MPALEADLGTINAIIDEVFPQVSTSFTLQEILTYASAYSEYTLGDNMGFPADNTTDTLSGLGSIVIPQDLVSNVSKLHEFLFGTNDYTPSSTVQTVNANIISTVGSAGSSSSSYSDDYYSGDYYYDNSGDYSDGYEDYGGDYNNGYSDDYDENPDSGDNADSGTGSVDTGGTDSGSEDTGGGETGEDAGGGSTGGETGVDAGGEAGTDTGGTP